MDLKTPGNELSGIHTPREIAHLAARARMVSSQVTLKFHDVSANISGEGRAKVSAKGRVNGISAKGESEDEVQDLELISTKIAKAGGSLRPFRWSRF